MNLVSTLGIDLAKSTFSVHGVDLDGEVVRLLQALVRSHTDTFSRAPALNAPWRATVRRIRKTQR